MQMGGGGDRESTTLFHPRYVELTVLLKILCKSLVLQININAFAIVVILTIVINVCVITEKKERKNDRIGNTCSESERKIILLSKQHAFI
jgi:hypothetical protein